MLGELSYFIRRSTSLEKCPPSTKGCRSITTTIKMIRNGSQSCRIRPGSYTSSLEVQLRCFLRANVLTYFCPTSNIELKDNTVIVVLGASGDLAKKKTVSGSRTTLSGTSLIGTTTVPSSLRPCKSIRGKLGRSPID